MKIKQSKIAQKMHLKDWLEKYPFSMIAIDTSGGCRENALKAFEKISFMLPKYLRVVEFTHDVSHVQTVRTFTQQLPIGGTADLQLVIDKFKSEQLTALLVITDGQLDTRHKNNNLPIGAYYVFQDGDAIPPAKSIDLITIFDPSDKRLVAMNEKQDCSERPEEILTEIEDELAKISRLISKMRNEFALRKQKRKK